MALWVCLSLGVSQNHVHGVQEVEILNFPATLPPSGKSGHYSAVTLGSGVSVCLTQCLSKLRPRRPRTWVRLHRLGLVRLG